MTLDNLYIFAPTDTTYIEKLREEFVSSGVG
jgi:hypothetical protein